MINCYRISSSLCIRYIPADSHSMRMRRSTNPSRSLLKQKWPAVNLSLVSGMKRRSALHFLHYLFFSAQPTSNSVLSSTVKGGKSKTKTNLIEASFNLNLTLAIAISLGVSSSEFRKRKPSEGQGSRSSCWWKLRGKGKDSEARGWLVVPVLDGGKRNGSASCCAASLTQFSFSTAAGLWDRILNIQVLIN